MKLLLLASLSVFAFDHSHKAWNQLLSQYVVKQNGQVLVNYRALKASPQKLDSYLKSLSAVSQAEYEKFSKDQKFSFWVNAYNAFTWKLIIDHYPIRSIRKIGGVFTNPWKMEFFKLLGKKMHLDGIEHGTLRDQWKEHRIHFVVNCASISCPNLPLQAIVAKDLEKQLSQAEESFLKNKSKNDVKKKTIYASKIFDWYGEDFAGLGEVEGYLKKFYKLSGEVEVEFLDYDWDLNEA